MAMTSAQRKRLERERKTCGGLFKRYEVYVHPEDIDRIRELEKKLQERRENQTR